MSDKTQHVHRGKREMMWNNFLGGIAWSLGAILGTALFLGALGLIASNINFIPIIGEFISNIIDYVITTNRNIQQ